MPRLLGVGCAGGMIKLSLDEAVRYLAVATLVVELCDCKQGWWYRFSPVSLRTPLQKSALGQKRTSRLLFDNLVGHNQNLHWYIYAEHGCCFAVERCKESGRLLDGKFTRFCTFQDLVYVER